MYSMLVRDAFLSFNICIIILYYIIFSINKTIHSLYN